MSRAGRQPGVGNVREVPRRDYDELKKRSEPLFTRPPASVRAGLVRTAALLPSDAGRRLDRLHGSRWRPQLQWFEE